jgi:hypothetical protein
MRPGSSFSGIPTQQRNHLGLSSLYYCRQGPWARWGLTNHRPRSGIGLPAPMETCWRNGITPALESVAASRAAAKLIPVSCNKRKMSVSATVWCRASGTSGCVCIEMANGRSSRSAKGVQLSLRLTQLGFQLCEGCCCDISLELIQLSLSESRWVAKDSASAFATFRSVVRVMTLRAVSS